MADYRQGIVAVVIALLIVFLVQSSVDVFTEEPSYNDYCGHLELPNRGELSEEEWREAQSQHQENQDDCRAEYNEAQSEYNMIVFIVSLAAAAITILIGLYMPIRNSADIMVTSGIILGGLFTLFIGTFRGWDSLSEIVRPIVLLGELIIVIIISYYTIGKSNE